MKNPIIKFSQMLAILLPVTVLGLLCLDCYGSPDTSIKVIGISSKYLVIPFLLTYLLWRIFSNGHLLRQLYKILLFAEIIVEWLVIYAYLGISIVGVFGRFICQLIPQIRKITKFLPPYITLGYFGLTLFYFWEQLIHKSGIWQSWSEVAELALYTGTVIWTVFLLG